LLIATNTKNTNTNIKINVLTPPQQLMPFMVLAAICCPAPSTAQEGILAMIINNIGTTANAITTMVATAANLTR
jgi:hypothetical protein